MKRKFKLIVPSFVALIFCFLLIAGSTFALFTSKADASISVSTGKVKIEAQLGDMKRYSAIPDDNIAQNDPLYAGYATAHEVSSHYAYQLQGSGNGSFLTNGQATLSEENKLLTLDRIAPGDRVTLKLDIENKSDVNIKYRIRVNALELEDADQSYKLFKQLTIILDNDDSIDNDSLDDLNGVNKVGLWKTIGAGEAINDLMIDISLPVDSNDDYQELKTKIQFTVEAVQGNANTNTLLEQINDYLAQQGQSQKNKTMHEALQDVIAFGNLNSKTYNLDTIKDYLWNSETDQFYTEDSIEGFIGQYFKVYNTMPDVQTYNIYASNSWNVAEIEGLQVGFDAGDTTNITSIKYDRSTAAKGKEVIIRTNSSNTSLDVNAPLDVVHHYGPLGYLKIQQVANSSYHENGQVAFMEVSKGRVALEKDSEVTQLHISSIKEVNPQTNELVTTNEFDEIIISIHEDVEKPTFSRDDVEIASTGTLVVALQSGTADVTEDTELDYVWLTKQGIFEQIKVSDNSESMADAKWADELDSTKPAEAKTQGAAIDIANNIGRDSNNNIDVKVEVTKNEETKTYKVELNENRDLVVVDKDDTTKAEIATISHSGEVSVNNVTYTVALANNTETKATELVVTSQGEEPEVIKATAVEQSGLSEEQKEEQKESVVEEAVIEEVSSDVNNAARIKTTGYETLKAAIEAAKDGDTIILVKDITESISINKNITLDLAKYTLTAENNKAAITAYSLDNLTVKNGNINGQIRIGEQKATIIKWKHLNYGDDQYEAVYGYHPLAPAKNVVLQDLNVNSGNKPSLFFTNIEEDLIRGASTNYCDNNLYGHYIYKTGYTNKDQYIYNQKDEVFTACTDKDFVTVIGGTYIGSSFVGNMETYEEYGGELIEGVLKVCKGTTINNARAGRFVENGKVLVGITNSTFVVSDTIPAEYTARINDVYYTYAGGANDAIKFANIGEEVYINENAEYGKLIGQGEKFTVISLSENVSWTGARVLNSNYQIVATPDTANPLKIVYTVEFAAVARVYHVGDTRQTPNANTTYDDYGSLKLAVDSAGAGDYVMLMQDTVITDEEVISSSYVHYGINLSARMVLDLNGHTYTYTGSGTAIICTANTGTDGGQRAIRDTSVAKTGTVYATNGYAFAKYNQNTEKTVIHGGNFVSATTNAVWIKNANVFEINGGTFISLKNADPINAVSNTTISSNIVSIKTTVGSEQYLVINSDNSFEVRNLTKLDDEDYLLVIPANKKALLPAKPKIGYIFSWESVGSNAEGNGIAINNSANDVAYQTKWVGLTEFKIDLTETNAIVTVLVNGVEWDRISQVTVGDIIHVSVNYTESKQKTCTIKDQNNVSYSVDTDFEMPRARLTIKASSSNSCFAEGTLVTLENGNKVAIEEVKADDMLLTWNMFTGEYEYKQASIFVDHGKDNYKVLSLQFDDETTLRIIGDHGIFDYDLNEFVYLDSSNYNEYLGHRFVKANVAEQNYQIVTLVSGELSEEYIGAYSLTSIHNSNVFAEDLLTMAPPKEFYNWIQMSEDKLQYDLEAFENDLQLYGTYGYEVFEDYITYEQFENFNGQYLKVAVEKGLLSLEQIYGLIELYGQYMN